MKLRFWIGDLDLPERRGIPVVEWRRKKMHRLALVAKQERVELTWGRNGTCWRRKCDSMKSFDALDSREKKMDTRR